MHSSKILFAVILLISASQLAVSQNNTNSPYTRFGYGEISDGTATEIRGMGGVSLGNRSQNTINSVNPASYSSVDSLTFMFDLGAGMRYSHFSEKNQSKNTLNANLEYITMRFRLLNGLVSAQDFCLIRSQDTTSVSLIHSLYPEILRQKIHTKLVISSHFQAQEAFRNCMEDCR